MRARAPVELDIIGSPQEVRYSLERAYADGRLVSFTEPTPVVLVKAFIIPPHKQPMRQRLWEDPTWLLYGAAFLIPAGIVVVIIYAVISIAMAIATFIAVNIGAIVAVIVVLALLMIGGGAKCAGLHCGGCRG